MSVLTASGSAHPFPVISFRGYSSRTTCAH
jgi:hypothetical protein